MSDPMVKVFATYLDVAGRPMTGSVTFTPDISAPDDTPGTVLLSQQKVVARLNADGYFEVMLTASDDDGWRTGGVSIPYRVDERIPGIDRQRLVFVLKPGPVDLNTQPDVPIDYDGPVEVPVPGLPGPPGDPGPPGPPGPAGAAGYMHHQSVLSSLWDVRHGLGKHPVVAVEDGGGSVVQGTVKHIDNDRLTIGFAFTATGTATCV